MDDKIRQIIRAEIEAKGIKQVKVAASAGMRVDSFNMFIHGKRKLKADELISVSEYLGIPLSRYQQAQ